MDWLGGVHVRSWESLKDWARLCRFFCCCVPAILIILWMIDAICGAIYYEAWSPKFDLEDILVTSFNITPTYEELGELELNYDIQFSVRARRFSRLHSIEKFSYHFTTLYNGFILGESHVSDFRPLILESDKTCVVKSTQSAQHFPLEYNTWNSLRNDSREHSNMLMQIEIKGQVTSDLFWCMEKAQSRSCNVSIRSATLASRLLNKTCNDF
ncbi:hypothetical protein KC19_VG243600 [Ceratodon purpureus]|uniref:Uncharacterized protein n=1 Tax=Ceratodon purpureus TaxID=3225 RepID=A0A8T0HTC3_CERPU|nr:hypothetical protein KC19_VG243600 [Ceratodon purpureus]